MNPRPDIQILAINRASSAVFNDFLEEGEYSIPWLQDVTAESVWTQWSGVQNDVIILDRKGGRRAVYDYYHGTTYGLRSLLLSIEAEGEE